MRKCIKCAVEKLESDFPSKKNRCKVCTRAYEHAWAKANKDKRRAIDQRHYWSHRAARLLSSSLRSKKNRAKIAITEKQWRRKNPEKVAAKHRRWREKYPEKAKYHRDLYRARQPETVRAGIARWCANNAQRKAEKAALWAKVNASKLRARSARRYAEKLLATPVWANQGYIEDVYRKAAIFTKRDGTPWHVDHIVPLRSKLVCGLHCEDNLQVIPAQLNKQKFNSYWPDMPTNEAGSLQ